jgi:hypothetical protein
MAPKRSGPAHAGGLMEISYAIVRPSRRTCTRCLASGRKALLMGAPACRFAAWRRLCALVSQRADGTIWSAARPHSMLVWNGAASPDSGKRWKQRISNWYHMRLKPGTHLAQ